MRSKRVVILSVCIALLGVVGIGAPRNAHGAGSRQAAPVPTVNPNTLSVQSLNLPSWALPPTAHQVDSAVLSGAPCVPDTTGDIVDEFLLEHQDWCQGLGAATGIFQTFLLDQASPSPYVGEWAASVYGTADQAQTTLSGINAHLTADNDVDGPCTLMVTCTIASFQDEETITNPDGTTSPGKTLNVLYAVWVEGNIMAEVAIAYLPGQPDATAQAYLNSIVSNADVLVREILAGQQPAAPTAIPTPASTATPLPMATATSAATPLPMATATSAPTASPVPMATAISTPMATPMSTATSVSAPVPSKPVGFDVTTVRVEYGSANLDKALHRSSLRRIRLHQKVKLVIYGAFSGVQKATPAKLGFRITCGGRTAAINRQAVTLTTADNGGYTAYSEFWTANRMGQCSFAGTIFVNGKHKHKNVQFAVSPQA